MAVKFLNREIAQMEEEEERQVAIVSAEAERDLALLKVRALEALVTQYAKMVIDLKIEVELLKCKS
jgi:hypothetical protein